MQVESSTQIYFSKENVNTLQKAKRNLKVAKREFGRELNNVDRTPIAAEVTEAQNQEPAVSPLKHMFLAESSDKESVLAYQAQIFDHLRSKQAAYALGKDYLALQTDVTPKMRSILVDWLVDVSHKFKLLPQTLFQTVNTVDRYLAVKQVGKNELQLLGVTALMIQSKYEEVYPPQLKDFAAVCDNAYSQEQILDMEADVLVQLNFELSQASAFYFLQMIQIGIKIDMKPLTFARYILETSLLDAVVSKHANLTLAASAVFLVLKIFKLGSWTSEHSKQFGITDADLKACARDLYMTMQKIDASSLSAVKRKFATAEFFEVSKFKIEKVGGSR